MNEEDMGERGPAPEVGEQELLETVREIYTQVDRPYVQAKEIANEVGLSATRVRQKLDKLNGDVESATVGRAKIYWLPDESSR